MYNVRNVTDDLYWVGVNDHRTTLFENVHPIPKGVSYNSYLLLDKETVDMIAGLAKMKTDRLFQLESSL